MADLRAFAEPDGCGTALPASPARSRCSCSQRPFRFCPRFLPLAQRRAAARQAAHPLRRDCRLDHAAGARRGVPGAVRRRQSGHRLLVVADRSLRAARSDPADADDLLAVRAGRRLGVPAAAPAAISCASGAASSRLPLPAGDSAGKGRRESRTSSSARPPSCARWSSSTCCSRVQTVLDAAYLWGGVALPDGMTYASYAHRGAYPLIVTALLAAGFVLAAMRPGSATSNDPLIRRLVYALGRRRTSCWSSRRSCGSISMSASMR